MTKLTEKKCVPYEGDVDPLKEEETQEYLKEVKGWEAVKNHHIVKEFEFEDFQEALDFVNDISEISEEEGHHPHICFTWGEVKVKIWTHSIDGLHENDFILAAKFDGVNNG